MEAVNALHVQAQDHLVELLSSKIEQELQKDSLSLAALAAALQQAWPTAGPIVASNLADAGYSSGLDTAQGPQLVQADPSYSSKEVTSGVSDGAGETSDAGEQSGAD